MNRRLEKNLTIKKLEKGTYEIEFNGNELASGSYVYTIADLRI